MQVERKFRFETVHRVRKLQEKSKQRELGILFQSLDHTKTVIRRLKSDRDNEAKALATVTDPRWARTLSGRILFLEMKILENVKNINEIEKSIEEKRAEVDKATQGRKMFDTLSDRHASSLSDHDRREETKLNDDIAVRRFRVSNSGNLARRQ